MVAIKKRRIEGGDDKKSPEMKVSQLEAQIGGKTMNQRSKQAIDVRRPTDSRSKYRKDKYGRSEVRQMR